MVKTIGDGVMALFPAPDAAAKAAVKMHVAIEVLPAIGEKKLALRIGLHSGPVIDRGDDLFGYTVNVASRLSWRGYQRADSSVRGLGKSPRY